MIQRPVLTLLECPKFFKRQTNIKLVLPPVCALTAYWWSQELFNTNTNTIHATPLTSKIIGRLGALIIHTSADLRRHCFISAEGTCFCLWVLPHSHTHHSNHDGWCSQISVTFLLLHLNLVSCQLGDVSTYPGMMQAKLCFEKRGKRGPILPKEHHFSKKVTLFLVSIFYMLISKGYP